MLSSDIRRDDRGVDRCNQKIMKAVPNGNGVGYHNVESWCGCPITTRISDNVKGCPNCDKEPAVGNVQPRVTNAASVHLTPKELEECGLKEDVSKLDKPVVIKKPVKKVRAEKKAVEAKVAKIKKDAVEFEISLENLETAEDVARMLVKAASDGLDKIPVTNFAESKRLLRLQEKLEALLVM